MTEQADVEDQVFVGMRIGIDWVADLAHKLAALRKGAAQDVLEALADTLENHVADWDLAVIYHEHLKRGDD